MLIDNHTHLNTNPLFDNWQDYIQSFKNNGGKILINAGANNEYNRNGIEISKKSEILFGDMLIRCAIGWHPCDIPHINIDFEKRIDELRELYNQNKSSIIAIGECGIDVHFSEKAPVKIQQNALKMQAELAREINLPLMIHSRDAFYETMEVLQDYSDLKIYFHAWGYGPNELEIAEKSFSNLWIGCTNVIAYPSAKQIREAIKNVKTARILTETDAPYLPPQCLRGQQNEPAYISYVYDKLSEILNISILDLENMILKNSQNFYGISIE